MPDFMGKFPGNVPFREERFRRFRDDGAEPFLLVSQGHGVEGAFLRRHNRFEVECLVEGLPLRAHLPNPGKLRELLLPGAPLLLAPRQGGKLACRVLAVARGESWVMVDTIRTNALAAYLLRNNLVPGLEGAEVLQAEYSLGNSRFDFLLRKDGVPFLLEVKSCTLFHRELAMFPDAETARGRKHVEELAELAREGYRCGVLFVVQSGDVRFFLPDYHTDYAFSTALLEARHILDITAVGVDWQERGGIPALDWDRPVRQLAIPWEIAEAECQDGGAYVLVLHLPEAREIEVGRLGTLVFREGYYVYVGSAVRYLAARMARHRRRRKTLHWHIDWLREHAAFVAALPVRTGEDLECALAEALAPLAAWRVPGFGSSDCACPSHLFGWTENPLLQRNFVEMLLDFRMGRVSARIEASAGVIGSTARFS